MSTTKTTKTTKSRASRAPASKTEVASKSAPKRVKDQAEKVLRSIPEDERVMRERLSKTLKAWMSATPRLETQMKLAKASGLGQRTIGRILSCEAAASVDILQEIAKAFGRDVEELLLDPEMTRIHYDVKRYSQLPTYERVRVDAFIAEVLKEYEGRKDGNE